MRLIELPVFTNKTEPETTKVFINPENVLFVAPADVPTPVVDNQGRPVQRMGAVVGGSGGMALLIDMAVNEVLTNLQGPQKGSTADESNKSSAKDKKGVRNRSKAKSG